VSLSVAAAGCTGFIDNEPTETVSDLVTNLCAGKGFNRNEGARLFEHETFGGNGRTCATCHDPATNFTVSPADAKRRFEANPNDPLFVGDGSDDGNGNGVSRMLEDATIAITMPLPANIRIKDSKARTVTVNRGIFTLRDSPAVEKPNVVFEPALMWDGRAGNLQDQALDAIVTHAQPDSMPKAKDLAKIALYQTTDEFFTSQEMKDFACSDGPAPGLPEGRTESEKRGRNFFVSRPQPTEPPFDLRCSNCHDGPLLNEHDGGDGFPDVKGAKFEDVFVATFNEGGNPLIDFIVTNPDGSEWTLTTSDPGRLLVSTATPVCPSDVCLPCDIFIPYNPELESKRGNICAVEPFDVVAFKIPSLRNIKNTAPYFHDNSAKTLEEVMAHYVNLFQLAFDEGLPPGGDGRLTQQDVDDIIAYMQLL